MNEFWFSETEFIIKAVLLVFMGFIAGVVSTEFYHMWVDVRKEKNE